MLGKFFAALTIVVVSIVSIVVFSAGVGFFGIEWIRFFGPKKENVRREVFEETKSYVHGKTQDLAKYYEEYTKAESLSDKEAIESLIKMNFAEFDAEDIENHRLRSFLISVRRY